MKSALIALSVLAVSSSALAHVTVAPNEGKPSTKTIVTFHVGHGCGEAKTTAVRVDIPRKLTEAHPMDVPGWTLTSKGRGGKTTQVTWTAASAGATGTDFEIHIGLPPYEQTLYVPVTQICGKTQVRWNQKPSAAGKVGDRPAPKIKVTLYPNTPPVLHLH